MTFHWPTVLREAAENLVDLSELPGWQAYARHKRDAMLADPVWEGLREEIQRVRRERKEAGDDARLPSQAPGAEGG